MRTRLKLEDTGPLGSAAAAAVPVLRAFASEGCASGLAHRKPVLRDPRLAAWPLGIAYGEGTCGDRPWRRPAAEEAEEDDVGRACAPASSCRTLSATGVPRRADVGRAVGGVKGGRGVCISANPARPRCNPGKLPLSLCDSWHRRDSNGRNHNERAWSKSSLLVLIRTIGTSYIGLLPRAVLCLVLTVPAFCGSGTMPGLLATGTGAAAPANDSIALQPTSAGPTVGRPGVVFDAPAPPADLPYAAPAPVVPTSPATNVRVRHSPRPPPPTDAPRWRPCTYETSSVSDYTGSVPSLPASAAWRHPHSRRSSPSTSRREHARQPEAERLSSGASSFLSTDFDVDWHGGESREVESVQSDASLSSPPLPASFETSRTRGECGTQEPAINVAPHLVREVKTNGMAYRRGGGFAALKQLAVVGLKDTAEEGANVAAYTKICRHFIADNGKVNLPRSPGGSLVRPSSPSEDDALEPSPQGTPPLVGYDFVRVRSNDWLNKRQDLFRDGTTIHTDTVNEIFSKHAIVTGKGGIHEVRQEQDRVATAKRREISSRPFSSSRGQAGPALDKQVHETEQTVTYDRPKALLPEIYQQVWSISTMAPERPRTPHLQLRRPTIPLWNPTSTMSPHRQFSYEKDQMRFPVIASASPRQQAFRARTPRSSLRLSIGFQPGQTERTGTREGESAFKLGPEVPFDIEGLESQVHAARSWQEPAGLPTHSVRHSPRVSQFLTNDPPIGADFASPHAPRTYGRFGLEIGERKMKQTADGCQVIPLDATSSFFLKAETDILSSSSHSGLVQRDPQQCLSSDASPRQQDMLAHVRPSLRPAAAYKALDCIYEYDKMAKEAASARARQRRAYQDSLVANTTATAANVMASIVIEVAEFMRGRELARLKREAAERAQLAHDKFERLCNELIIVRVIKAVDLPVDISEKDRVAPYMWATTGPVSKKRGARKTTAIPMNIDGFLAGLKKRAGVGTGKEALATVSTEAFTEIGSGVKHTWDEEFTLLVDKVGDRTLRFEAVDDNLKFGADGLGSLRIPIDSLPIAEPLTIGGKRETGWNTDDDKLFRAVGEEKQEWFELSEREINRDEEELEMILSLVEARGLIAADASGTSDPYCKLELDQRQKFKSKTKRKTLDPKWEQAFKFELGTYEDVFVKQATLKDSALLLMQQENKTDLFGNIASHGIAATSPILDDEHDQRKVASRAHAEATAPAVLHIRVLQARNLIAADSGGTSDPYVRIHVGREIANGVKTNVIRKTLNPEWNETFEINIRENQRTEVLTLEVFDKDLIGKDDSLGKITLELDHLSLRQVFSGDLLTSWHALEQEPGIVGNGEVQLSYELVKRYSQRKEQACPKKITVSIWDYNMGGFGTDVFLGQVVLPLNLLKPDENFDDWLDLEPRPENFRKDVVKGQVRLRAMCRFKKDPNKPDTVVQVKPGRVLLQLQRVKELPEEHPTEISLTVIGAKDLHLRLDTDERPDTLAVVSMDGRKMLSDVVKNEIDPEWDADFLFDTLRGNSTVHVSLFDSMPRAGGTDGLRPRHRFLGKAEVDTSNLQVGRAHVMNLPLVQGWREPEDTSSSLLQDLQIIVRLLEAKDILAADRGGTSDPYATLEVDGNPKQISKVYKKTLKPKWRETFRFQLGAYPRQVSEKDKSKNRTLWKKARKKNAGKMSLQSGGGDKVKANLDSTIKSQNSTGRPCSATTNITTNTMLTSFSDIVKGAKKTLTIAIWDQDIGPNPDDFLGCVVLPLDLVSEGDNFEDWFELRPGQDKSQVSGLVKLGIKVTERWDPEPVSGSVSLRVERVSKDVAPEEIVVEVLQAREIQSADRGGTSDPFVIVKFHGPRIAKAATAKTQVVFKSLAPVWDEMFVLSKERGAKHLIFDIFDYDRFGINDFLGRAFMSMSTITQTGQALWIPLRDKNGDKDDYGGITGEIQVRVRRRPQGSVVPEELLLHVIEAKGLMAADRNGTSDPFALVTFEGSSRCSRTWTTRVIEKNLHPVWDERFVLDIEETAKKLVVDVYDDDILGCSDFLGRVAVPMTEIINGQVLQEWFPLSSMNEEALQQQEELVVQVIAAKDIKAADRGGTSDPFAVVSFGGGSQRISSQKTKTIYKTICPEWNESFCFSLNTRPEELYIDIFDYDLVGMNDFLGRVKIAMSSLEPDTTIQGVFDLGHKLKRENKKMGQTENCAETSPGKAIVEVTQGTGGTNGTGGTGDGGREKTSVKKILHAFSDKMHEMVEKGMDFLRGEEEGITGSVHLKITRRPRDFGSIHLKISRHDREPFTRTLVVHLIAGRNFLGADKAGDSDPYVVFLVEGSVDKKKRKSRVIDGNNIDPEWNQTFRIPVRGELGFLRMDIFDHDKIGKHQLLGKALLDVSDFQHDANKMLDRWIPLTGQNPKLGPASGDVRVRVSMDLEHVQPRQPPPPQRKLQVVVIEARDLVAADRGGTSDPFVAVQVSGVKSTKTKVVKKTLHPEWNQTLELILPPGNEEPLRCQVFDHDVIGANDFLGEVVVPLDVLDFGQVVDKWYDLEPRENKDELVSGSIHLQVVIQPLS